MIRGAVGPSLESRITLTLLDAADSPVTLGLVIDSAFSGFLALPTAVVTHLVLPSLGRHDVVLADGSTITRNNYEARVEWQGTIRTVRAVEMGTEPLVGINFLWGHRLTIDVVVGGDVTIEPLP
jgi:predicted aspartyl protease